jgi:HEAT repeat protein
MTLAGLLATEADDRRSALAGLASDVNGADYVVRELLLGDEDATVRAAAAKWLERARARSCETALVDALYDSHPSVRMAACRALAKLRSHEARPTLRRLAIEEPIWWVRRAAVVALARIERHEAIPVLRDALDDPFWRVRHAAARVLLALGSVGREKEEHVAAILAADAFEGSDRARGALRWLERRLRPTGDERAPAPVPVQQPQGLVADPDPAVIAARLEHGAPASPAELALYIGDPHEALRKEAAVRLRETSDVRVLLAAALWLEDPRIPHATAAVVALLDALSQDVVEALLDEALAAPDSRSGLAAWALSYVELNHRWDRLAEVTRAMDAKALVVRRIATSALGAFLSSGAAHREVGEEALQRSYSSASCSERSYSSASCRGRLIAALDDTDEDVHRLAVRGLLHSGRTDAWRALLSLAFSEEPVLVRRLLVIVARETRHLGTLRLAARDVDPETRAHALAALHRGNALSSDELLAARANADPRVRASVLDAEVALDALRSDVDPFLKRSAFEVAARCGLALDAARIAKDNTDAWLRVRAAERLARSDADADLVHVLGLSRDPDVAVRAAAADVLDVSNDLAERLVRVRDAGSDVVRDAADTWLGVREVQLMEEAVAGSRVSTTSGSANASTEPGAEAWSVPSVAASARALGRTGIAISPLVLSGANEPSVTALFGAANAGCNAFFWEPRYRNLTTFLRSARTRGHRPVVVCGTYHATERAIRSDVHRALRRLRRDQLDVFLVFWTRSEARLEGEVPRALERLVRDGLVRATGFSTHDRALATSAMGNGPWDVVMVRHSAAHPGAEERLFERAEQTGTGVLGFSATSYGRLLKRVHGSTVTPPTAAECYRYTLSQHGVTACVSAPRGGRELTENLEVLARPTLEASRLEELRVHGRRVREASLDFANHIRRFPAQPDTMDDALDAIDSLTPIHDLEELALATDAQGS